jgi:hypothetical protein
MRLATRGRRRAATTLFPGNYLVFRHLALQIPNNGVRVAPIANSLDNQIRQMLIPWLKREARDNPEWLEFRDVDEDKIELVEPISITGNVKPTSWWCTNPKCNRFFYGALSQVGINSAKCPDCKQKKLVQFPAIFMCPTCHAVEQVQNVKCPECRDSRSVILTGKGGRRLSYRWKCTRHPDFKLFVGKNCLRDQTRMVLKSVGGRIYHAETWSHVTPRTIKSLKPQVISSLSFAPSRATVIDVTIGRIPVANPDAYYQGNEQSFKEPFVNPDTGRYMGFVSFIETDAITVSHAGGAGFDDLTLHSLEHALLNAAPAVTGLTQDEFGSDLNYDKGELVIYDNVYGGSGGCRLLADRRLNRWLQVVRELAECYQVQCDSACRGCLFLPSRLCRHINHDLDRNTVLNLIAPSP